MFLKHKQTLHLQKAVSGWEIKWSKSHQYLPSLVSTCLSDTILKKSWSIPHTQPSCQHDVFFPHTASSTDNWISEKWWKINERQGEETITNILSYNFFYPPSFLHNCVDLDCVDNISISTWETNNWCKKKTNSRYQGCFDQLSRHPLSQTCHYKTLYETPCSYMQKRSWSCCL